MRRSPAGVLALVALAGCHSPPPLGPPPTCTPGPRPALAAVALTWDAAARGWAALIPEGRTLFLRTLDAELNLRGERQLVWQVTPSPSTAALVSWRGGLVAAHCEAAGGAVRVQRLAAGQVFDPGDAGVTATGELHLAAWRDASAALFVEDAQGTAMVRLDGDGMPDGVSRCGARVLPRTVVARADGYVGVEVLRDGDGNETGLDVVRLDGRCTLVRRTALWRGAVNGRAVSLTNGDGSTVAVWSDREGRAWVGSARDEGALGIRPHVLEQGVRAPMVFARRDGAGRRRGLRVLALRSNEVHDRALVYTLDTAGELRDTAGIGEAPSLAWRVRAADPWGGAVAVWTLPDPTRGATLHRDATLGAMVRVCP